jgi:hypothetical protein
MVCNLTSSIGVDDRNINWRQQMLDFSALPKCIHGRVLHEPDFIGCALAAAIGEAFH